MVGLGWILGLGLGFYSIYMLFVRFIIGWWVMVGVGTGVGYLLELIDYILYFICKIIITQTQNNYHLLDMKNTTNQQPQP